MDNSGFTDIHKENEHSFFPDILDVRKAAIKKIFIQNINLIRIYSQLSLKILNNNTSLIFSKVIIMTLKKPE